MQENRKKPSHLSSLYRVMSILRSSSGFKRQSSTPRSLTCLCQSKQCQLEEIENRRLCPRFQGYRRYPATQSWMYQRMYSYVRVSGEVLTAQTTQRTTHNGTSHRQKIESPPTPPKLYFDRFVEQEELFYFMFLFFSCWLVRETGNRRRRETNDKHHKRGERQTDRDRQRKRQRESERERIRREVGHACKNYTKREGAGRYALTQRLRENRRSEIGDPLHF